MNRCIILLLYTGMTLYERISVHHDSYIPIEGRCILQKIKIVLIILAITLFLNACNSGDDAVLSDDGSLNVDNRLEEILAAIDENDRDELENMFSKTALLQVDNFQEQTEDLFQLFEGSVKSWERTGFTSSSYIEDGEKNTQNIAWYDVTTGKAEYVFFTIECIKDTEQPDNIGLNTLAVVKKADEESKFTYWQDMQIPGIYVP